MSSEQESLSPEYEPTSIDECIGIYNQYVQIIFEDIMVQTPTVVLFRTMLNGAMWKDPSWCINNHSAFIHNNMEVFASNDMKQIATFIVNHEFTEQKKDWIDVLHVSPQAANSMVECIKRDFMSVYQNYPKWSQNIIRGMFVTYITYLKLLQN